MNGTTAKDRHEKLARKYMYEYSPVDLPPIEDFHSTPVQVVNKRSIVDRTSKHDVLGRKDGRIFIVCAFCALSCALRRIIIYYLANTHRMGRSIINSTAYKYGHR